MVGTFVAAGPVTIGKTAAGTPVMQSVPASGMVDTDIVLLQFKFRRPEGRGAIDSPQFWVVAGTDEFTVFTNIALESDVDVNWIAWTGV